MDHVTWKITLPEFAADTGDFIGRKVAHTAHPDSKAPKWRKFRKAGQQTVMVYDFPDTFTTQQKNIKIGLFGQDLYRSGGMIGKREF